MVPKNGWGNVEQWVKNCTDTQIVLYTQEISVLVANESVFATTLWLDLDKLFKLLNHECLVRLNRTLPKEDRLDM